MKSLVVAIIAASLIGSIAYAQVGPAAVAAASAPSAPAAPGTRLEIKLTPEQLNLVARGLAELPYKDAAPLFSELQRQLAPPPAPTTATPASKK